MEGHLYPSIATSIPLTTIFSIIFKQFTFFRQYFRLALKQANIKFVFQGFFRDSYLTLQPVSAYCFYFIFFVRWFFIHDKSKWSGQLENLLTKQYAIPDISDGVRSILVECFVNWEHLPVPRVLCFLRFMAHNEQGRIYQGGVGYIATPELSV